jgi:hypothetical protein
MFSIHSQNLNLKFNLYAKKKREISIGGIKIVQGNKLILNFAHEVKQIKRIGD